MFVLFVDMKLKPGAEAALKKTYTESFRPAISRQEGFRGTELLQPNKAGEQWRLSIAFETHELQKNWVALELHQVVWPQMEHHFADYSVNNYTSI
ncbi:MAG: antibiotic biosynthesis monooxygenase [Acidobacteriaceae bacterium]